jgi:hypothetical protein
MLTESDHIASNSPARVGTALDQLRREEFVATAKTIEQDFRRLVQSLQRAAEFPEVGEQELLQQIRNTQAVAERGLRLSKLLSKLARRKRN